MTSNFKKSHIHPRTLKFSEKKKKKENYHLVCSSLCVKVRRHSQSKHNSTDIKMCYDQKICSLNPSTSYWTKKNVNRHRWTLFIIRRVIKINHI